MHDTELWVRFTESIVVGMGGDPVLSRSCAVELVREWERHENFFLYDDTLPTLAELRRHGLRIGLVSNGSATSRSSRATTRSTSTCASAR